jgi:hypothetical protein
LNPPLLPVVLAPGAAVQFAVTFTPLKPGTSEGRLQIGEAAFDLIAEGTGPVLTYSFDSGVGLVPIPGSGTVAWGSVQVGKSMPAGFVISNQSARAATISTVGVVEPKSAYTIADPPDLPAVIPPGGLLSFSLRFAPAAAGENAARLRVDSETFTLLGFGTAPPPLPEIQISGPTGSVEPMQQPAVGLALASPYTLPLQGTLRMAVSASNFSTDPAVQFSTGGRSVAFVIPPNSTRAVFPSGTEVRFQTGTVAAVISISATFTTESGIDLTPSSPPAISVQVEDGVPRVLDLQVESRSSSTFVVILTGFATGRSLTQLELEFTTSPQYTVASGRFALSIRAASEAWYRSTGSQSYGSLFTATLPFTFQAPDSARLNQVVQSITAVLVNDRGRSNTLTTIPGL